MKKLLEDKGIDFEEQGENIKVKGKLFISEGFEIDNTAENRLKLEAENIKFFKKRKTKGSFCSFESEESCYTVGSWNSGWTNRGFGYTGCFEPDRAA